MILPRRLILLILFIAIPLLEIALLIKVGQLIGVLPTVMIVIGTAILGVFLLQRQSFSVMTRASEAIAEGRTPMGPVVDGAFQMLAAILLITPGLMADAIGFMLLIPFLRSALAKLIVGGLVKSGNLHVMVFGDQPPSRSDRRTDHETRSEDGTIIDGEFTRIDDAEPDHKPKR